MLIRKGTRVVLDLRDGRSVVCPAKWGMFHDPDGHEWKQSQVLVIPYSETGEVIEYGPARSYFGSGYDIIHGESDPPPRALTQWTKVGALKKIWYTRPGTRHPGPFKHKVGDGWLDWLLGKRRAFLYRRRGAFLLDFPDGLTADARGCVHP